MFGIGEIVIIILITSALGVFFARDRFAPGGHRRFGRRHGNPEFEDRVLDELDVLRVRLDLISKRLDNAGIESPPEDPLLPPASE